MATQYVFKNILTILKHAPTSNSQYAEFLIHFEKLLALDCPDRILIALIFYETRLMQPTPTNRENSVLHAYLVEMCNRLENPYSHNGRFEFSQIASSRDDYKDFLNSFYTFLSISEEEKPSIKWETIAVHLNALYLSVEEKEQITKPIVDALFKYPGNNPQRLSFIHFMKYLSGNHSHISMFIGMLYYELEESRSLYFSALHDIISKVLPTIKNPYYGKPLNELDPTIFVVTAYQSLIRDDMNIPIECLQGPWKDQRDILNAVDRKLPVFIKNDSSLIAKLLSNPPPVHIVLHKMGVFLQKTNVDDLNATEKEALSMLALIHDYGRQRFDYINQLKKANATKARELAEQKKAAEQKKPEDASEAAEEVNVDDPIEEDLLSLKNVFLGIICLALNKISDSKSIPYTQCLRILNIDDINQISVERKLDWLKNVDTYFTNRLKRKDKPEIKKLINGAVSEINKLRRNLEQQTESSTVEWTVTTGLTYAGRYGFGLFTTSSILAKGLSVLGFEAAMASGPIGWIVWTAGTAGGAIIINYIGDKAIPKAASETWDYALTTASRAGSVKLVAGTKYVYKLTKENFDILMGNKPIEAGAIEELEPAHNKKDWIETYRLHLPNKEEFFPQKYKDRIATIYGFDGNNLDENLVHQFSVTR